MKIKFNNDTSIDLEKLIAVPRDWVTQETGFKRSTRDAYIQRLRVRGLVNIRGDSMVKVSDFLLD